MADDTGRLAVAAGVLSPAEEKRVARELSPAVAWPTIALAVVLPAAFLGTVGLGLTRTISLWACAPLLAILSYAHYTLVHEAIHDNLAPRAPFGRWLTPLVGWIGSLALGSSWPLLMRTHVLHHAHTNTPDDPDIYVKGTLLQLVGKWLSYVATSLIPLPIAAHLDPKQFGPSLRPLRQSEVWQDAFVTVGTLALLGVSIWAGRTLDWLFLFFIPTRVGVLILAVLFQWLPHHPFDRTERYLNTRISLWRGGSLVTLQQNLHLVHHLWPGVPFYNYGRLYRLLRTTLVAKGSRSEGLRLGRDLPRD